jgi:hypothetical protein
VVSLRRLIGLLGVLAPLRIQDTTVGQARHDKERANHDCQNATSLKMDGGSCQRADLGRCVEPTAIQYLRPDPCHAPFPTNKQTNIPSHPIPSHPSFTPHIHFTLFPSTVVLGNRPLTTMTTSRSLPELAHIISSRANSIYDAYDAADLPQPSFDYGTSHYGGPFTRRVEDSRAQLLEAIDELRSLILGPAGHIFFLSFKTVSTFICIKQRLTAKIITIWG